MRISKFLILAISILILVGTTFAVDGDLDTTFNPVFSAAAEIYKTQTMPDGKIFVAGGFTTVNGVSRGGIAKLNADGTLDTTFDPGTSANTAFVQSFAVQQDGKIVVGGNFTSFNGVATNRIARLNPNGTLDTTFTVGTGFNSSVWSVQVQPTDGKIWATGAFASYNGRQARSVTRLNSDGTIDITFNTMFTVLTGVNLVNLQKDGRVLVGAGLNFSNSYEWRFGLAQIYPDGRLDTKYVPHNYNFTDNSAVITDINVRPNGKILIAGNVKLNTVNKHIALSNPDGTFDPTFDSGTDANNTIFKTLTLPDGKILISGNFTTYNGITANRVARLNANGSLDTNFVANADAGIVYSMEKQADGKVLVGGGFANFNGVPRTGLARIINTTKPLNRYDFDGDGKADLGYQKIVGGNRPWTILQSSNGITRTIRSLGGVSGEQMTPADFDGDAISDPALWRGGSATTAGFFSNWSGDDSFAYAQFGITGDSPCPGDWDGDGKADLATYRPGATVGAQSFFYFRSSGIYGSHFQGIPFGLNGDLQVAGDYDGDRRMDAAVFRPSEGKWHIQGSVSGYYTINWGLSTDKLVPADYDGDGKTDAAVFRASETTWYILKSSDGQMLARQFGLATDKLVPADYDGDGKTDIATYRDGVWYIFQSSNNQLFATTFGTATDSPVELIP
jgi:uncharacterized delta-60 repeat protein